MVCHFIFPASGLRRSIEEEQREHNDFHSTVASPRWGKSRRRAEHLMYHVGLLTVFSLFGSLFMRSCYAKSGAQTGTLRSENFGVLGEVPGQHPGARPADETCPFSSSERRLDPLHRKRDQDGQSASVSKPHWLHSGSPKGAARLLAMSFGGSPFPALPS